MILWQRNASARWLARNEMLLAELASPNLAIISRPGRARSLVQMVCRRRARAEMLRRKFGGAIQQCSRNWLRATPSHPPIRIGRRLQIVNEPTQASERSQLIIPAADAFGTGEHATTAMSLRLLEETTRKFSPGWRLFDAGTGTGILALAARKLGAGEVLGIDNDPRAIVNARYNARLNRIRGLRFVGGDVLQLKPQARYEIVTANLFSELLIAALPIFGRALRPKGWLILSGILREQADDVIAASAKRGFSLEQQRRRGKWVALVCRCFAPRSAKKAAE